MIKEKRIVTLPASKHRTLICYPIIHSMEDLGQFKEVVRQARIEKSGLASVQRKAAVVNRLWQNIDQSIQELSLTGTTTVRLYQDGLAVCGKEKEIVKDMVEQGSANYRLLANLMAQGMILMGTESPGLLVEEYEAAKVRMKNPDIFSNKNFDQKLLEQRDRFIADRIDQTLSCKETGIIFLGGLHNLEKYLNQDIHLVYPLYFPAKKVP